MKIERQSTIIQLLKVSIFLGEALFVAFVLLWLYRALFIFLNTLFDKKNSKNNTYSITFSSISYAIYFFFYSLSWYFIFKGANDFENFSYFLIMGGSAILWCYYEWPGHKLISFPKLRYDEVGENHVRIKKIMVFSVVMIVTVQFAPVTGL